MAKPVQQQPNLNDDHGNPGRSPQVESLLTFKKQVQNQRDLTQRTLDEVERVLATADQAWRDVQTLWADYCDVSNRWQAAQQLVEAAKTGETRISEIIYRILLVGVLAAGALALAAIQSTASSMLVVILLFFLPCLLYIVLKVKQLQHARRNLPSTSGVGDPDVLGKACKKMRERYERAQEVAQRKYPDRAILVSRVQQAQQDLAKWAYQVREAEIKLQAQHSLERAKRQQG